jgi:hypothetical protein
MEAHFLGETVPEPGGLVRWVPSNGVRLLVRAAELAKGRELLGLDQRAQGGESGDAARLGAAPEKDGKPVLLRACRSITEAMLDRTALESAGIPCFLYDDNLIRMGWLVSGAVGGAKLFVSEKDAAEARKILDAARPPEG